MLRRYRPADATALTDLYVRSVRHYGPRAYTPEQVDAWAATADSARTAARCSDGRVVVVAQDQAGTVLGFAELETDGHLDMLYVAPDAEGLRLGTLLYTALETQARDLGLHRLFVEASELARPCSNGRVSPSSAGMIGCWQAWTSTTTGWKSGWRRDETTAIAPPRRRLGRSEA